MSKSIDAVDAVDAIVKLNEKVKELKAENKKLKSGNEKLRDGIEFWMNEGDGTEWPPENARWKELAGLPKDIRTPEQLKELQHLTDIITWKSNEKIQYERAERLCRDNEKLQKAVQTVRSWLRTKNICVWIHDEDDEKWGTSCGEAYCFLKGGPKENKMEVCPYCDKTLEQVAERGE